MSRRFYMLSAVASGVVIGALVCCPGRTTSIPPAVPAQIDPSFVVSQWRMNNLDVTEGMRFTSQERLQFLVDIVPADRKPNEPATVPNAKNAKLPSPTFVEYRIRFASDDLDLERRSFRFPNIFSRHRPRSFPQTYSCGTFAPQYPGVYELQIVAVQKRSGELPTVPWWKDSRIVAAVLVTVEVQ